MQRSLSDHCPLVLKEKVQNWGPKPFRVFNGWKEILGFTKFVKEKWGEMQVSGWATFVVKEKLKELKQHLRVWSKNNVQNVTQQLIEVKEELARWDLKGETNDLLVRERLNNEGSVCPNYIG